MLWGKSHSFSGNWLHHFLRSVCSGIQKSISYILLLSTGSRSMGENDTSMDNYKQCGKCLGGNRPREHRSAEEVHLNSLGVGSGGHRKLLEGGERLCRGSKKEAREERGTVHMLALGQEAQQRVPPNHTGRQAGLASHPSSATPCNPAILQLGPVLRAVIVGSLGHSED